VKKVVKKASYWVSVIMLITFFKGEVIKHALRAVCR